MKNYQFISRDFHKDLRALEANKTQIMTMAEGYPVEVTVGDKSYVVTTRTDLDNLIKTLKEQIKMESSKATEQTVSLTRAEVLLLIDAIDDKYAGRSHLISYTTRQIYKETCSKLHRILRNL